MVSRDRRRYAAYQDHLAGRTGGPSLNFAIAHRRDSPNLRGGRSPRDWRRPYRAVIVYREATRNDIETIAQLHARSWRRAYRGILRDDFLDEGLIHNRRDVWHERLTRPPLSQHVMV